MTLMTHDHSTSMPPAASAAGLPRTRGGLRRTALATSLAALLALSACGGGEVSFDIGILVGGQPVSGVVIQPGQPQQISIRAGESLELDASEPVQWTLMVGGSAVSGSGTSVSYQGVTITVTALSSSRIALDTYAPYLLASPVPIRLSAVSTLDASLVATVDVLITN